MRSPLALAALAAAVALAPSVHAQVRFIPYTGYNLAAGIDLGESLDQNELSESGGVIAGLGVEFAVTPGFLPVALKIRPSIETAFLRGEPAAANALQPGTPGTAQRSAADTGDFSQSYYQANLDLVAEFSPPAAPLAIYGGIGGAFGMYQSSFEDIDDSDLNDTSIGGNAFVGARFGGGFIQPFIQGRYTLMTIQPGANDLPEGTEFDEDDELHTGISVLAGISIGL